MSYPSVPQTCSVVPRLLLSVVGAVLTGPLVVSAAEPPRMFVPTIAVKDAASASGTRVNFSLMRLPDGEFAFYDRSQPRTEPLSMVDRQGRPYAFIPSLKPEFTTHPILRSGILANTQVISTRQNQIVSLFVQAEKIEKNQVAEVGLPIYLNVWVRHADPASISAPTMVWRGYNGSQMEYEQLPSGRLLVPFGSFQPHGKAIPPNGRHQVIILYSDDGGHHWKTSDSKLVSPCYDGFNGSNEGACEPAIEQLADGRIWMLCRSQTGFLYESLSNDEGTTWEPARASRFSTSTGPANILRHRDGSLVVCWNNCELPPRAEGVGVYGGRDALHIAVSHDDGKTWRGFREIYLDHRRNDNPSKSGDRGTAYPLAGYAADGSIVVIAGQGEGGRFPIVVDPEWITQTEVSSDFSTGLEEWSVYKHDGPAKAWWRARVVGCELIDHPSRPSSKILHLRKPNDQAADGATWNFPNGWSGRFSTRVRLPAGSQGGSLALNDRFFDPANDHGERLAVYRVHFSTDPDSTSAPAGVPSIKLSPDKWHDLEVIWDLSKPFAELRVDGEQACQLPLGQPTLNGLSYIRFRSTAIQKDDAGFYVEGVQVHVEDPYAPSHPPETIREHEQRYIQNVVPTWKAS